MSMQIEVGQKKFALGLDWLSIQSEKQAALETMNTRERASVIRKCRDKSMQLGIAESDSANNAIVAADMVARWKPSSSLIYIMQIEREEDPPFYWGAACVHSKIMQGGDVLFESEKDLTAWIGDFLFLHAFEIYADSSASSILQQADIDHQIQGFADLSKNFGKLKVTKAKGNKNLLPWLLLLIVLAATGGGGWYYSRQLMGSKTVELTPEQKQAIIDDWERKEKESITQALAADDYVAAQHYVNAMSSYPTAAMMWTVISKSIDMPTRIAMVQWHMEQGGFMSQLSTMRPNAQIVLDNSQTSGQLATEAISVSPSMHNSAQKLNAVTPKLVVDKYLTELTQRLGVKLTRTTEAPVLAMSPPTNSGVIYTPKYRKAGFTLAGNDYASLAMSLDGLSVAPNLKPTKITMLFNHSIISAWTIENIAYTTAK